MKKEIKTVAIMTSGGDAPGMNAAIRAVVRTLEYKGKKILGIRRGFKGLLESDIFEMQSKDVSDILQNGGTILYTARSEEFMKPEVQERGAKICEVFGIDALVVIGGNGSFKGAQALSKFGISVVGIPATIDLDINCTDYTIGFDTAVNTAMENIDKIRDTSASHERVSIVEVMGRHAGYLALWSGLICGSEEILVPEMECNTNEIIKAILQNRSKGKMHNLIVMAEGVGGAIELAKKIQDITGIATRATILGHLQRGGRPTAVDRMHATRMGVYAANLVCESTNRVVAYRDGVYVDYDIDEADKMIKRFPTDTYNDSRIISKRY